MRLSDKVAIITGSASGMGETEARLFCEEGAHVIIADISNQDGERIVSEINQQGGSSYFVHTDVTSESDWQNLIHEVLDRYQKIDILINNAGISASAFPDDTDLYGWLQIMEVNATGVYLGTRAVLPEMTKNRQGSIVNISSHLGFVGSAYGHPAYHASKGAVRIFTKAIAVAHGPNGIRANSVHPGGVLPPMKSANTSAYPYAEMVQQTPLRRPGTAREVANGVLFIASDEASFITGTELVIDGGTLAQ